MDADGVETRHFCHRARSCSLKAFCAHPRSALRLRDGHRLHTVDLRGTVLIPLSAPRFHSCTLLPMHTLTVTMRRTLSSVRRRLIDRVQVHRSSLLVHLGFLLLLRVHRHCPIRFLDQFPSFSWGFPFCTGCGGGFL